MNRNYAALDLETGAEMPEGENWRDHRPLGITCAALYSPALGEPVSWTGTDPDGEIADRMSEEELRLLVRMLLHLQEDRGFTLLTWNGAGFDFDVLAEESGMPEECRRLALNHVDPMFHLLCKRGFPLGLDAAARGMGLTGKTEGMDGGAAVRMWKEGEREDVIAYCENDARATWETAAAAEESRSLKWTSRSGNKRSLSLLAGWLTVRQAMKLPLPDTGWMDNPLTREAVAGWLENNTGGLK